MCVNFFLPFNTSCLSQNCRSAFINFLIFVYYRGDDFRKDYSQLGMLCSTFPAVPVVALTATASKIDIKRIKDSLLMKNPVEVVISPNRPNIFYEKVFRKGEDIDFYEEILQPLADGLKLRNVDFPLTILYLPLRWCGFAYKFMERALGTEQYFPVNSAAEPENRLFAQYHAPQTLQMKEQILKELSCDQSKVRIIFATVAMGMGVDIPSIRQIIHIGPPRTVREYCQETGRAGRDGQQANALLYYNNRDIAKNREGISDKIRAFCRLNDSCLREFLLRCFDVGKHTNTMVGHQCCSHCRLYCDCAECASHI